MPGVPLLVVRDLSIGFRGGRNILSGVSIEVERGSIVGLSGPSGRGKTTLALAILKLLPPEQYEVRGEIALQDGARMAMIFQDPLLALNPVLRMSRQIREAMRARGAVGSPAELLAQAGIRDTDRVLRAYAHELSGGELQRVAIAQALAGRPELILADEPFTALDAPRVVELAKLFRRLRDELGSAFLLISHDAGVLGALADRVVEL
jgi:ABC-type glutathione transport system ATPase component